MVVSSAEESPATADDAGGGGGGEEKEEEEEGGGGSPGLEAAFFEAAELMDAKTKALPKFDEKETEQMTREFFDVVQKRLEDSPASDKKIWDALSSRAGFARVSLMLKASYLVT